MSAANRELKTREALRGTNWLRRLVSRFNRRIAASLHRKALRMKYQQCHDEAGRICWMGFENGKAQQHLDAAKDSLYQAALVFKAETDEANDQGHQSQPGAGPQLK